MADENMALTGDLLAKPQVVKDIIIYLYALLNTPKGHYNDEEVKCIHVHREATDQCSDTATQGESDWCKHEYSLTVKLWLIGSQCRYAGFIAVARLVDQISWALDHQLNSELSTKWVEGWQKDIEGRERVTPGIWRELEALRNRSSYFLGNPEAYSRFTPTFQPPEKRPWYSERSWT